MINMIFFADNSLDMTVTRPEPSEGNRLVVLAGDRESGDTCRTFVFHKEKPCLYYLIFLMIFLSSTQDLMVTIGVTMQYQCNRYGSS